MITIMVKIMLCTATFLAEKLLRNEALLLVTAFNPLQSQLPEGSDHTTRVLLSGLIGHLRHHLGYSTSSCKRAGTLLYPKGGNSRKALHSALHELRENTQESDICVIDERKKAPRVMQGQSHLVFFLT